MSWKTAATAVYTAYFQSAGPCHLEESPTVLGSRVQLGWGGGWWGMAGVLHLSLTISCNPTNMRINIPG